MRRLQRVARASNRLGLESPEPETSLSIGGRPAKSRKNLRGFGRGLPDFHTGIIEWRSVAIEQAAFQRYRLTRGAKPGQICPALILQ